MNKKTTSNRVQKEIKKLLKEGVYENIFPAGAAGVVRGVGSGKKKTQAVYGYASLYPEKKALEEKTFFDLASLTKPLATVMSVLCLIKEKKIKLDETLPSLLGRKIAGAKRRITVRNLLSHSSGLPAHRKYFRILKDVSADKKGEILEKLILEEDLEYDPGKKSVYSDLGFMLLGLISEKRSGYSLDAYAEEKVLKPLKLEKNIFYNSLSDKSRSSEKKEFAATEYCSWRRKTLCGEVHDDNCYSMGGISGHSGLFGNIEGVTVYIEKILEMWRGKAEHPNIEREDLLYFLKKQKNIPDSSWALGFDTPAGKNSSSGKHMSPESIGHLGFTGTSFWIDPTKNTGIVLLTNRVHPSRNNTKIKQFRPYFHDRVMEELLGLDL